MSIREFSPSEIADLRTEIDRMSDWMLGQKFHTLLDKYEADDLEAKEQIERLEDEVSSAEEDKRCLEDEVRALEAHCGKLEKAQRG